jgi:hypothetical protein
MMVELTPKHFDQIHGKNDCENQGNDYCSQIENNFLWNSQKIMGMG